MDFSNLYSLDFSESKESRYKEVKDTKDISPAGKIEFEKAKSILSTVSPRTNLSMYDHMCAILRKVLRFGIEDAVDTLEEISHSIKDEKRKPETEIIEGILLDENLQKVIEQKKQFYKLSPIDEIKPVIKPSTTVDEEDTAGYEEDEEEETEDATEGESLVMPDLAVSLPDLYHKMSRFRLGGIGLSEEEVHDLNVALRDLAQTFKLEKVEFWGKIFASKGNYYIAECPYQSNVPRESFGYEKEKEKTDDENVKEDPVDEENSESENVTDEDEEQSDEDATDEEEETDTDEKPKIPPIPEPKLKKEIYIPPEEDGTGVNEYLYFVSINIVGKWHCLPSLLPQHITAAKRIKRFFTGNLEGEIGGGICFPGKEAHYLRAQIARISASTNIAPENFYMIHEDEEEEEEQVKKLDKNEEYEAVSVKDVYSQGLEAWVHYRHAILDQGRCTPAKIGDEENEDEEEDDDEEDDDEDGDEEDSEGQEDEDPEIFEAAKETEVPLLRSLSEDKSGQT